MTSRNYAQHQAERIIRERDITAPRGHALCAREPFAVDLQAGHTVTFAGGEVARRSGLPYAEVPRPGVSLAKVGELAGALVLAPCHVRANVTGRSWPWFDGLRAWRVVFLRFIDGDTVELHPVRSGTLTLWPVYLAEPYVEPDLSARGLWDLKR